MNLFPLISSLPDIVSSIPHDENTVALFGMLIGVTGGIFITYYMDQLKAKKAKIERKRDPRDER